jgi:hypothetical protein
VTTPDLPADRPIPDTDDLRLLAELINNVSIPLANAAWNARMSQAEAAARLVSMAERGLPLRLVADGDRQTLWHIAQAGPATGAVAVTSSPGPGTSGATGGLSSAQAGGPGPAQAGGPGPAVAAAVPAAPQPSDVPGSGPMSGLASGPLPDQPAPSPVPPARPAPSASGPVVLPPTPPVPPHEQAIAGAVPLGRPPFGPSEPTPQVVAEPPSSLQTPESAPGLPDSGRHSAVAAATDEAAAPVGQGQSASALWGPPGTSSWARTDDEPAAVEPSVIAQPGSAPEPLPAPEPQAAAEPVSAPEPQAAAEPVSAPEPQAAAEPQAAPEQPAAPVPRAQPIWASIPVAGPAGEQLMVTILDVLDPGDEVLTGAGYRMEPGQRAVLVHSSVANTGQVPYYPVGDLYLVLETDNRALLGRANIAVASHPAFPVGVTPGRTADGWSVFLIPSETVLAGIKWCIRPDMPQTILSWPIIP